jgi:hypothetical protein
MIVEVSPVHVTAAVKAAEVGVSTGTPVIRIKQQKLQTNMGYAAVKSTAYKATGLQLTVAEAGDYDISWSGWRSSSSGTNGSRLYINGVAHDAVHTAFVNVGQFVKIKGVHLEAGDVIEVWARSRNTSSTMTVAGLIIREVVE